MDQSYLPLLEAYQKASRRLIILDFEEAIDPAGLLTEKVKTMLTTLGESHGDEVCIFSSMDNQTMNDLLGDMRLNLVAENGRWIRLKNLEWIAELQRPEIGMRNSAIQNMASREEYQFVLIAGDSIVRELRTERLPHRSATHTVLMSDKQHRADYRLAEPAHLFDLLQWLHSNAKAEAL